MEREAALTDHEALRAIQAILGLTLFGIGVYMVGPWYIVLPDQASFAYLILAAELYVRIIAFIEFVIGSLMMYGAVKGNNKVTRIAIWAGFSMFTLIVATRLIVVGLIPIFWVPQMACMLICGVLALALSRRR